MLSLGPGGWIELHYANGENYHSHCGGIARSARILFDCDPFAGKVHTCLSTYKMYKQV